MRSYWNDQTLINVRSPLYLRMLDELLADTSLHTAMIDRVMLNYATSLVSRDALDKRYKDISNVSKRLFRPSLVSLRQSVSYFCVVFSWCTQTQRSDWEQVGSNAS